MMDTLGKKLTNWVVSMMYGYIRKNPDVVKNELKAMVELEEPYKTWYQKFVDNVLWDVIIYFLEKILESKG